MNHKTIKTQTLRIVACFAIFVSSICLALVSVFSVKADFTTEKPIEKLYYVGETLEIPAGTFADGSQAQSITVTYPNGTLKRTDKINFDEAGKYVIEYSAQVGGKRVTQKKELYACLKKYASDKSSNAAEYRENVSFKAGADSTATANGIYVELSEGSKFTYNKVFDLTGKTKNDVVFSANIISSTDGWADFYDLTVRFTDIYDSNNYVDVVLWHNSYPDHADDLISDTTNFIRASVSGQPSVGINWDEKKVQVDNYGMWTDVTMMNSDRAENNYGSTLDISFDYAGKKVYGPNRRLN